MFSLKKWFLALMVVFFSGAAIAELSPDEVVKKTADDVISAIKSDKDIQAGNHFFKLNIFNLYPYRHHHQHYHIKIG